MIPMLSKAVADSVRSHLAVARKPRILLATLAGVAAVAAIGAHADAQCVAGPCGVPAIGPGPECATTTYTCTNRYLSHSLVEGAPGAPVPLGTLTCDACGSDQDQEAGPISVSVTTGVQVCVSVGSEIDLSVPVAGPGLKLKSSTQLCLDTQQTFSNEHKVKCRARTKVRGDVVEIPTPVTLTVQFEEVLKVKTLPLSGDPCRIGTGSALEIPCRQYSVPSTATNHHVVQKFVDQACPPVTPTACVETHTLYPHEDVEDTAGGLYIWVPSDVIRCP